MPCAANHRRPDLLLGSQWTCCVHFWGCFNRVPQAGGLQNRNVVSVLEAAGLRAGLGSGLVLSEAVRESVLSHWLLVAAAVLSSPWHVDTGTGSLVFSWSLMSVCRLGPHFHFLLGHGPAALWLLVSCSICTGLIPDPHVPRRLQLGFWLFILRGDHSTQDSHLTLIRILISHPVPWPGGACAYTHVCIRVQISSVPYYAQRGTRNQGENNPQGRAPI